VSQRESSGAFHRGHVSPAALFYYRSLARHVIWRRNYYVLSVGYIVRRRASLPPIEVSFLCKVQEYNPIQSGDWFIHWLARSQSNVLLEKARVFFSVREARQWQQTCAIDFEGLPINARFFFFVNYFIVNIPK